MSIVMVLGLTPVDVFAESLIGFSNAISISQILPLGAPNDGGTSSGIGTAGTDIKISTGGTATIVTQTVGTLWGSNRDNTSSASVSVSAGGGAYVSWTAPVGTSSNASRYYTFTITGLQPTNSTVTVTLTISRTRNGTTNTRQVPVRVTVIPTVTFYTSAGVSYNSVSVDKGTSLGASMPAEPSAEGLVFLGWQTSGGTAFTSSTLVNADMSVYAKWGAKVSFYKQPSELYAEVTVDAGAAVGSAMPANPTAPGQIFLGWEAGGSAFTSSTVVTTATQVNAVWQQNYAGTFMKPDGSSTVVIANDNQDVTPPAASYAGHDFRFWTLQVVCPQSLYQPVS